MLNSLIIKSGGPFLSTPNSRPGRQRDWFFTDSGG
jgi:hypothetical protein